MSVSEQHCRPGAPLQGNSATRRTFAVPNWNNWNSQLEHPQQLETQIRDAKLPSRNDDPWVEDHWSNGCTLDLKVASSKQQLKSLWTATAGSDVVQSGRPIFDDFFQHLWPYFGNNTANVVFQMVKRLWLIRIDQ
ncbi:hypothetical protein TNCV_1565761 [Trichonephila clavipes]|nr:hypothetical protein TNCV_1565761 [Trichonephila clavipes]